MWPKFSVRLTLLLAATGLAGCRGGSDLMPLDVGHSWTYMVTAPQSFKTFVVPMKVTRELSVANVRGAEINSTLGVSRLAWIGDGLMAEKLAGTQFIPPLPIVFKAEETHERPWKGRVVFVDRSSPATGTQSQKGDDLDFGGSKIHCIRSTVRLKTAAHSIELITWFSAGLGIVQQEQRTDEKLLVKSTLLPLKQP
jgi:hypothetical protein